MFLAKMRIALKERLTQTDVRVRSPAVVVPFGTDEQETFEVVPADYIEKTSDQFNVYDIPDRHGDWMKSSPQAHNGYIKEIDAKLQRRLRLLIRLMKAWKYYNDVPIRSFYLEMKTAQFAAGETVIIYKYDVTSVLRRLNNEGLVGMRDPVGISGRINAGTPSEIERAKAKVSSGLRRATNAMDSEEKGDVTTAFYWWDQVFNGRFPSY